MLSSKSYCTSSLFPDISLPLPASTRTDFPWWSGFAFLQLLQMFAALRQVLYIYSRHSNSSYISFVFLVHMSYGSTSFINCDKKDLETCCEKLLTQPPRFQFETSATLLCYFPYLSSTLMSLKILYFFFYLFESSKKSAPKYTALSWISVTVADLRETARVHSPAASALLTSILKELRCNMKVNFRDRQSSLPLGLLHCLQILLSCFFPPRLEALFWYIGNVFPVPSEEPAFAYGHISSASLSHARRRAHPPLLTCSCLSLLFHGR